MVYYAHNNQNGGNILYDSDDMIQAKLDIKINFGKENYNLKTINTLSELHFLDRDIGMEIRPDKEYTGFIIWGLLDFNQLDTNNDPKYYSNFCLNTSRSASEPFKCGTVVIRCTDSDVNDDTYGPYINDRYKEYPKNHPKNFFDYITINKEGNRRNVKQLLKARACLPHAQIFETFFNQKLRNSNINANFLHNYILYLRSNNIELLISGITKELNKNWEFKSGQFNNFYNSFTLNKSVSMLKYEKYHRSPNSDLLFLLNSKKNYKKLNITPIIPLLSNFFDKINDDLNEDEIFLLMNKFQDFRFNPDLNSIILKMFDDLNPLIKKSERYIKTEGQSNLVLTELIYKLIATKGLKNEIINMTLSDYKMTSSEGNIIDIGVDEFNINRKKILNYTQKYFIDKSRDLKNDKTKNLLKSEPLIISDIFSDCVKIKVINYEYNNDISEILLYLVDVENYNISCLYSKSNMIIDDHVYFIDFHNKEQRDMMFDGLSKIYNFEMEGSDEDIINYISIYKKLVTKVGDEYILGKEINIIGDININLDLFLNKVFDNNLKFIKQCRSDLIHIGKFLNNINMENYKETLYSLLNYIILYSENLNKNLSLDLLNYITIRRKVFFNMLRSIVEFYQKKINKNPKYVNIKNEDFVNKNLIFLSDNFHKDLSPNKIYNDENKSIGKWDHFYQNRLKLGPIIHTKPLDSSYLRFKSIINNINDKYMKNSEKSFHINQMVYCGNYDINSNVFASIISKSDDKWSPLDIIIMANFLYKNKISVNGWNFNKKEEYYLLKGNDITTYEELLNKKNVRDENIVLIRSLIIENKDKIIESTDEYNNLTYNQLLYGKLANYTILYDPLYYENPNIINIINQLEKIFNYLFRKDLHINDSYDESSIYYFNEMISYPTNEIIIENEKSVIRSKSLANYPTYRIQSNSYIFNDTTYKKPFNVDLLYNNFLIFIEAYRNKKLLLITNIEEEINKSIKSKSSDFKFVNVDLNDRERKLLDKMDLRRRSKLQGSNGLLRREFKQYKPIFNKYLKYKIKYLELKKGEN